VHLFQYPGVTYWPRYRIWRNLLAQNLHDSHGFQIIIRAKELSMLEIRLAQIILHDISIPHCNDWYTLVLCKLERGKPTQPSGTIMQAREGRVSRNYGVS
jgi:hypothetical protein